MKALISILLVCSLLAVSPIAHALVVLGCQVSFSPGFVNCVVDKKDAAVADANAAKDKTIQGLQNSPFLANLQAEKDLLVYTRESANEMAQCLSEAQISFGTVLSNAVNNPNNLIMSRFLALVNEATDQNQPLV